MRLRIFSPAREEVDLHVTAVALQGAAGAFTVLPRHIDTVAVLVPGLVTFWTADGGEQIVAVDGGTVVKVGDDVLVSTPTAVHTRGLDAVGETVARTLLAREAHEEAARQALGRLQTDVVERMVELEEAESQ